MIYDNDVSSLFTRSLPFCDYQKPSLQFSCDIHIYHVHRFIVDHIKQFCNSIRSSDNECWLKDEGLTSDCQEYIHRSEERKDGTEEVKMLCKVPGRCKIEIIFIKTLNNIPYLYLESTFEMVTLLSCLNSASSRSL